MLHTAPGQLADSVLGHASERTAAHLTTVLHQHAEAAGWPSHVRSGMTVGWKDGEDFHVHMDPSIHAEAMDLEYGTQDSPPRAAIRQFHNRLDSHAETAAGQAILDRLGWVL